MQTVELKWYKNMLLIVCKEHLVIYKGPAVSAWRCWDLNSRPFRSDIQRLISTTELPLPQPVDFSDPVVIGECGCGFRLGILGFGVPGDNPNPFHLKCLFFLEFKKKIIANLVKKFFFLKTPMYTLGISPHGKFVWLNWFSSWLPSFKISGSRLNHTGVQTCSTCRKIN